MVDYELRERMQEKLGKQRYRELVADLTNELELIQKTFQAVKKLKSTPQRRVILKALNEVTVDIYKKLEELGYDE
jgi:hypothetical protein